MKGLDGRTLPRTAKGRPALVRRLYGLLLAVHRYGRHRARTPDERRWTARLIDALEQARQMAVTSPTTDASPPVGLSAFGGGRSDSQTDSR